MQSATASQAISDSVANTRLATSSLDRKKSGSEQHQLATVVLVDMYTMSKSVIFVSLVMSQPAASPWGLARSVAGSSTLSRWTMATSSPVTQRITARTPSLAAMKAGGVVMMLSRWSRLCGGCSAVGFHRKQCA